MSKIDAIKDKTDAQKKARDVVRKEARAHELGFEDIEDFELWSALEDLRKATQDRRREESERDNPAQKVRLTTGTLNVTNNPIFAA